MESAKESLNSSLLKLDISQLKIDPVTSHSKSAHGKCKLFQVEKVVAQRTATVLCFKEFELTKDESEGDKDKNNMELKVMKKTYKTAN